MLLKIDFEQHFHVLSPLILKSIILYERPTFKPDEVCLELRFRLTMLTLATISCIHIINENHL